MDTTSSTIQTSVKWNKIKYCDHSDRPFKNLTAYKYPQNLLLANVSWNYLGAPFLAKFQWIDLSVSQIKTQNLSPTRLRCLDKVKSRTLHRVRTAFFILQFLKSWFYALSRDVHNFRRTWFDKIKFPTKYTNSVFHIRLALWPHTVRVSHFNYGYNTLLHTALSLSLSLGIICCSNESLGVTSSGEVIWVMDTEQLFLVKEIPKCF